MKAWDLYLADPNPDDGIDEYEIRGGLVDFDMMAYLRQQEEELAASQFGQFLQNKIEQKKAETPTSKKEEKEQKKAAQPTQVGVSIFVKMMLFFIVILLFLNLVSD